VLKYGLIVLAHSNRSTGFNGGSALGANMRAAQACIVTNLAASVGGLTWMAWVRPSLKDKAFTSYSQAVRITASKESGLQSGSALAPSLLWWLSPLVPVMLVLVCTFSFAFLCRRNLNLNPYSCSCSVRLHGRYNL